MAPRTSARGSQRVSYRESEDEDSNVDMEESFDDSEHDSSPPRSPPRSRRPKRKLRKDPIQEASTRTRRKDRVSYIEEFSDDEASDIPSSQSGQDCEDDGVGYSSQSHRNKKARMTTREPRKIGRSPQIRPQRRPERSVHKLPTRSKNVGFAPRDVVPFVTDGVTPRWTSLPYELLVDIMTYASYPLFDEHNLPSSSIAWLLKTALICKAFLEPALAALYKCPPLPHAVKPHLLLAALSRPPSDTTISYNVKVKRLELEVRSTLAYSAGTGYGALDPGSLIQHLPKLSEIDIWSVYDSRRHRHSIYPAKQWTYPDSLFTTLSAGEQRLKSFHWNSRLLGIVEDEPRNAYIWMQGIHSSTPFQSLRRLTLTNFFGDSETRKLLLGPAITPVKAPSATQISREEARQEWRQATKQEDEILARAISALPRLMLLDLQRCSIVDGEWLLLLPNTLTSLSISECERLDSAGLQTFLMSHGSHLKTLILNHNPAMSISFLTTLESTCPQLEIFVMDLTYYSKHRGTGAREPEYENLLLPEEQPTWPSTLQSIEMLHLRQWTSSAAESFFRSLIGSAETLPSLRRLTLVVSINISWRDRATFRDQWVEKIDRVFLRKSAPPNPHWMSLRGFREWKAKQNAETVLSHSDMTLAVDCASPPSEPQQSDSGNKRRLRPRKTSDPEVLATIVGPSVSLRDAVMQTLENFVQGMCDIVDIRIDNLRPTENQWHENDFLDSEVSGDDDWDEAKGDADDEVLYQRKSKNGRKGGYAW